MMRGRVGETGRLRVSLPAAFRSRATRTLARARDESGQAFVEFAIIVPLLLIIILAIIQFSVVYNHWETLTDATRAGGRAAATCRFGGNATSAFLAAATDLPGVSSSNVSVGSCPGSTGGQITVTGSYPYSISVFGLVVKSGNLTATAVERVE